MNNLVITTPTDCEVVITRAFDAPRHLVFDALTKPELLRRWYGPEGWTMTICEVDLRVGGKWRFVSQQPSGKVIGQCGVYQEIVPAERLVNTETWEDWDGGETLVTTMLREDGGKTAYTSTILFPSREVRDVVVKNGLEHGAKQLYEKLERVLATLQ